MVPKNRKFNVAGSTFYSGKVESGDLVFFSLEPDNPKDKNAIKILNAKGDFIGYVPKESAKEFHEFIAGKYPHYCAKVKEIWDADFGKIPKILSHFANDPAELPYEKQDFL